MESRPQNPEFRNNPENFHQCSNRMLQFCCFNYIGMVYHLSSGVISQNFEILLVSEYDS